MTFQLNLEQLRKRAKERVRERHSAGEDAGLADVQFALARELGFASWPKLRTLVELGADPNQRGTFGGPDHGEGVTAIHLASQAGRSETVRALLGLGADPRIRDSLHDGDALGWARFGGHEDLADLLR